MNDGFHTFILYPIRYRTYAELCREYAGSDVKPEQHHVAVLNDVILALSAHLAGLFGAAFAIVRDIVFKGDRLSADKAFFKVAMDDPGSLRRGPARPDGPGARLFRAGGEIGLQAKQRLARMDQAVEAWFLEAERFEKLGLLLVFQLRDLRFDLG